MFTTGELWQFLPLGYALTVALELPVLWLGLSPIHSWKRKLVAGFWLTACTYPIVVLVLRMLLQGKTLASYVTYLAVAETFAPLAECFLFWLAFYHGHEAAAERLTRGTFARDMAAIVLANLLSFLLGLLLLWLL